jgi:hypothetical protein
VFVIIVIIKLVPVEHFNEVTALILDQISFINSIVNITLLN